MVSANCTVESKPMGMRAAYSVSSNGFSAAMSISAASSTTAGSGATFDGTFTLYFGSAISSFMALSCIAES